MKERDLKDQLDDFERLIRQGKGDDVRRTLLKMPSKKIPRLNLVQFANIARRVGLRDIAVQSLHPVIRPQKLLVEPSTVSERTEYSAALIETGAVGEAQELLSEIEREGKDPRAFLYLAFSSFRNWQYGAAIKKLNSYLKFDLDTYQRLVGEVNLAAGLTFIAQTDAASELIEKLISQTFKNNYVLLLGNLHELKAQVQIQKKNFRGAIDSLNESERLIGTSGNISYLYAKKWRAIIDAQKAENLHKAFNEVLPVMEEARFRREWETLRDIDRQLGALFQDKYLAAKLTFGTPFSDYRKMIGQEFSKVKIPTEFFLTNRWQWQPNGRILEVESGCLDGKNIGLKPGALLHRFISVLVTDFYRPFSLGALFSHLFPDEFYNPFTAYDRLYQCAKRTREVFANEELPIEIRQQNYEFSLKVCGSVSLFMKINQMEHNSSGAAFYKNLFRDLSNRSAETGTFSAQDLAQELKVSVRTANRIIKDHAEAHCLAGVGGGKHKRYRLIA